VRRFYGPSKRSPRIEGERVFLRADYASVEICKPGILAPSQSVDANVLMSAAAVLVAVSAVPVVASNAGQFPCRRALRGVAQPVAQRAANVW
jgi:hypothetical protein